MDAPDSEAAERPAIVNCDRCGSHFAPKAEEIVCATCIEWAGILQRCGDVQRAARSIPRYYRR